jgi:hypothetical protein
MGRNQPKALEKTEWSQPVEATAGVSAVTHFETVDEAAERDALREGRDIRAPGKCVIPDRLVRLFRFESELEGNPRQITPPSIRTRGR